MLIYDLHQNDRPSSNQVAFKGKLKSLGLEKFLREDKLLLPAVSELQVVRHYTRLSRKNFSIDTNFYPLGSCTMKYNPKGVHNAQNHKNFTALHPLQDINLSQGTLEIFYELQNYLKDLTGMDGVSLTPMAGAQGEFAGVAMIKAYHAACGDKERTEMLIPDAAHGTNPATAGMCGYKVVEVPTAKDGDLDLEALENLVSHKTAGIMLTNPSTLGLFIKNISKVAQIIHKAGGLLYYDGANLNAILGKVKPKEMGFDVMHLNLHKTFATPHGGGGPGAGPIAVSEKLLPFLPVPIVIKNNDTFKFSDYKDFPQSIGRLSTFMGNSAVLLRAYFYLRLLGQQGVRRVADFATLNSNYLAKRLADIGYTLSYPERRQSHEFIVTLKQEKALYGVNAMDVAKRLLDYNIHAPTTYFPLLIPECLLIEPTETESKEELDNFVSVMSKIRTEIIHNPEVVKTAPHTFSVKRLDDVKAVRELKLQYF